MQASFQNYNALVMVWLHYCLSKTVWCTSE